MQAMSRGACRHPLSLQPLFRPEIIGMRGSVLDAGLQADDVRVSDVEFAEP
jgi:hypothetical protein